MCFNDFFHKYNLKRRTTSTTRTQQIFSYLYLSDVESYLRDGPFEFDKGIVNLHPPRGTHWVAYNTQIYFDSYGCTPPKKLSRFIIKQNRHCLFSEHKVQGLKTRKSSHCAAHCL